jgi:dTDP-4-dehydrorhamnose reductase
MTRLLVTGAAGQLGADLLHVLSTRDDLEAAGLTRSELDITDPAAVESTLDRVRPDLVLNAAAYTAVDQAESDEDRAHLVNAVAPGVLALACGRLGVGLVHVSTDYVFSGDASEPYRVDTPPAPKSAYGRTKLAGERAVLAALPAASWVVRTAWVYGQTGANFVKTMARLERSRPTVDVVDDQRGSPTWSRDLAGGLVELAAAVTGPGRRPEPGVYHCTNGGETTWYGFARAVFAELGADPDRVRPTTTDRFPRPAPRPAYSVLSDAAWRAAGLSALRPWRDALHAAFAEIGPALR